MASSRSTIRHDGENNVSQTYFKIVTFTLLFRRPQTETQNVTGECYYTVLRKCKYNPIITGRRKITERVREREKEREREREREGEIERERVKYQRL